MAKQPSSNLLLQRERMRHFLTQSELAEIIGVATKTVQRWELGLSTPRAYYMGKLCEYFGKTPEALGFPRGARRRKEMTGRGDRPQRPCQRMGILLSGFSSTCSSPVWW